MTEAGDLIERLCVAAGMIMEDTAEATLILATVDVEQRLTLLSRVGADITAIATAAMVIRRRYADPQA